LVGRSWSSGSEYKYGFNGKESDKEIYGNGNTYDYGFRIYNSRLGKFFSKDPLCNSYPSLSPYNYAANNPILLVDNVGKNIEIYYENEQGIKKPVFIILTDYEGSYTISNTWFNDYPAVKNYFNDIENPTTYNFKGLDKSLDKNSSKYDAYMTSAGAGLFAVGGFGISFDFIKINEGNDAGGIYSYFTFAAGIGGMIGAAVQSGPVHFNEESGQELSRRTFTGWSYATSAGIPLIGATSIKGYVNTEEECLFGQNCGTEVYNAEIGGVGISKWKVGFSRTGNQSWLLNSEPLFKTTGENLNNKNNESSSTASKGNYTYQLDSDEINDDYGSYGQ